MATVAPPADAAPDRVPEELANGTPEPLREKAWPAATLTALALLDEPKRP